MDAPDSFPRKPERTGAPGASQPATDTHAGPNFRSRATRAGGRRPATRPNVRPDRNAHPSGSGDGRAERSLQVICAVAAVAIVLFTAYVSFVPFDIDPRVTLHDALHALERRSAWRVGSRSNFIGNILLYFPVGFFAAAAVSSPSAGWKRRLLLSPVVLALSLASSVAIESAQAFIPSRVSSVSDCAAQLTGALAGLLTWFLVETEVYGWWRRRRSGAVGQVPSLWFALYLGAYALAALLPLDVTLDVGRLARKWRDGGILLNPLHSPSWSALFAPGPIANVVLALPIGLLASIVGSRPGYRRSAPAAVAISAVSLGVIEAAQVIVISRAVDTGDFLISCAAATAGVVLATGLLARQQREASRAFSWSSAGLAASVVIYAAYNWAPFDPVLSPSLIRARLAAFWQPPFYAHDFHFETKAIVETLIEIAISAPMGLFWTLWFIGPLYRLRRTLTIIGLGLTALFAAIVELGEVFLPSRSPDSTDVIVAVVGFVVGLTIARRFCAARAFSGEGDCPAGPLDVEQERQFG